MKLEIKNLIKKFGEEEILNIPYFFVENVKSIAIIGPSGGGKSTFLKILGTIESAKADILKINEINVLDKNNEREYLNKIGYVFQNNNLFPNLTILENITIQLTSVFKIKKLKANIIAENWMKKVGILEHKNKKPHQISGGQAQRVAIVRALVCGASMLFLDEPTSALDPILAYEVMQTLIQIKEESEIIMVTHELNFAKKFADYYIFICDGKIKEHGFISELNNSKNLYINNFVKMIEFK
ncbi:ATP-binding cassette domain-containing protein [Clostridium tarantellae]|uniref:ATP-binding cassette domain-containing protein n=1 Tax=Clostridium tarantellae TaxID=39493 RepID=A0A6I1MRX0_9CLOT|nr:ATP-binding cassette domain-containing protein [Clostridium tarantellae]MPQ45208.1 ATP-binding cassette domain-containing protein [Clostridium tarantellae]